MFNLPLHWKLTVLPAVVALVLVFGVLWLSDRLLEDRLRHEASAQAAQAANLLAKRLTRVMERRVAELRLIADLAELHDPILTGGPQRALERSLRFSPSFTWLGLRDASGRHVASTGESPLVLMNATAAPASAQGVRISDVHADAAFSESLRQKEDELYIDLSVITAAGEGAGSELIGRIAWRNVAQFRDDQRDDDLVGGVLRLVVLSGQRLLIDDGLPASWLAEINAFDALPVGTPSDQPWGPRGGGPRLLLVRASSPVHAGGNTLDWHVFAVQDAESIVEPAAVLKGSVLWAGLMVAVAVGLLGYLVSRRLVRPFGPFLEEIAKRVAEAPADAGTAMTRHLDAITAELDASPQIGALRHSATDVLDQLVEGAQRMQAVLEQIPAGVLLIDPQGTLVFSNRAAHDILHIAIEHRRQPFLTGFADPLTRRHLAQVTTPHLHDGDSGMTEKLNLNDGTVRWCHLRAAPLTDRPGTRQGMLLVVHDVTARVHAEESVMRYQKDLQSLAHQLLTQEKMTTARLAQSLHDQLGQTLTALRLCLDTAPADAMVPRGAIARARDLASRAVEEVRGVLIELRPPLLDEQGLRAALDNEVALHVDRHTEVDILLEHDGPVTRRWAADVEYAAFMIAREAIGNALQHARATVVRVSLRSPLDGLHLEVEDDGCGLPGGLPVARPGHFGVVGMRERAAAVGARFEIGNSNGAGVIVQFAWPGAA